MRGVQRTHLALHTVDAPMAGGVSVRRPCRTSCYSAVSRCPARCQRFPISCHSRGRGNAQITGSQRLVERGLPRLHPLPTPLSVPPHPSEAITSTQPSAAPNVSPSGPGSRTPAPYRHCPLLEPDLFHSKLQSPSSPRLVGHICRRKDSLAFFPLFLAPPSAPFCPTPLYSLS